MKKCVECQFIKRTAVQTPEGTHMAFVCSHEECADPVNGDPILCGMARTNPVFCGWDGRYYKPKETPAPEDKKVIQLAK